MEPHRGKPYENVVAIIPARYGSTRLEGKLLLSIDGKPLVVHTAKRVLRSKNVSRVIVATDDSRILSACESTGIESILTAKDHPSGTDRVAEVANGLRDESIILNVQADEPLISTDVINRAIDEMIADDAINFVSVCEPIQTVEEALDTNVVKVVFDKNNDAIYFSRAPIPFPREAVIENGRLKEALENQSAILKNFRKHVGLYVYRKDALIDFTASKQVELESIEMLEQLRILYYGGKIRIVESIDMTIGVDTREDFERVKTIIESGKSKI